MDDYISDLKLISLSIIILLLLLFFYLLSCLQQFILASFRIACHFHREQNPFFQFSFFLYVQTHGGLPYRMSELHPFSIFYIFISPYPNIDSLSVCYPVIINCYQTLLFFPSSLSPNPSRPIWKPPYQFSSLSSQRKGQMEKKFLSIFTLISVGSLGCISFISHV